MKDIFSLNHKTRGIIALSYMDKKIIHWDSKREKIHKMGARAWRTHVIMVKPSRFETV